MSLGEFVDDSVPSFEKGEKDHEKIALHKAV
jgi:hypothetical protein